ncbi:hypothetical protein PYW07_013393 [Mythimna separata]|uniref:NACHT domain-containing protein n=1 Tax=Mythimna separata TaxID=271217 RepID=A0AAD7Y6I1_MYTSE|nr:hypothetical protein PYW07_013393 [Mythimna separata]
MYTTAKTDLNTKEFKNDLANKLNSWIGTGDKGLQPGHKDEDIVFLCEIVMKKQFSAIAVQLAKFLSDNTKGDEEGNDDKKTNDSVMSMNDELLLQYHVILVQKVLDVSEIKFKNEKDEHRVASFRADFFTSDDEFVILFKDKLFIEMLKKRKLKESELNRLLSKLFTKPLDITVLSSLIGNVVTFDDKKFKLEFVSKPVSEDSKRQLEKVDVLQSQIKEAIEFAAKGMLEKRDFKVPASFGNKDLTIRGKEDNVEPLVYIASVIDSLKNKLVDLIETSSKENIIVIDESIGKEFLNINAGLAGTIGNILVPDENCKYLKFADNGVSGELANRLHTEVQSVVPSLHEYKFHIKVKTFPKLTFDCDDDEDLKMLKDQVTVLAQVVGQFICKDDDSILPMNDVILRYHVLMALKVFQVSEIQYVNEDDEHRLASFRQEFFESDEEFVVLLKKALYNEVLRIRQLNENKIDLAVYEILSSRQFKVPTAFGNKDLTITIKKSKTERRLDHLKSKISELIAKSGADRVVPLDESLGDGLLKLNGGIAGMIGNLLVLEENSKLMKFTDNWEALEELSKRLFIKLQSEIENLHEYKFNATVTKFPKLSFQRNEEDENLAKDFLKKLLFFTNQANEKGVEKFLKDEIEDHQCLKVNNVPVSVDTIFVQYHDLIQRWWMLKEAPYLTKQSKHYEDALALIRDKPLLSSISKEYMKKIKNNTDYTFSEKVLSNSKLKDHPPATVVVTESSALTVTKMVQSMKNVDHFVFDLEYILDLQAEDYNTVSMELKNTKENKIIIIVCNNINKNGTKRLENIANVLENKRTIFVIKQALVETIQTYFVQANNIVIDEKCSLLQMSENSQKSLLKNAKVKFQQVEVSLDLIVDENSMAFVEGEVLNTVMNNEPVVLGESISTVIYELFKHLYIDRRVFRVNNSGPNIRSSRQPGNVLLTLNDITDVALVTAEPGMGKTTLLTHLSLKTKDLNPEVWIIRINLLEHSEKFSKWQENKTNIDVLETLKIFCEVLTENQRGNNDFSIELEESNGVVSLKSCTGAELTAFQHKMFLDYYNRKEIIFLFEDFDEICPTYTDEVLALLTTVRNYPKKHKMWITSCKSYKKRIISKLKREFGNLYEIEHFTETEQHMYLVKFWKSNIALRELTIEQCDNLCSFVEFMATHYHTVDAYNLKPSVKSEKHRKQQVFMKVCLNFLSYLRNEVSSCPEFVVKKLNTLLSYCNYTVKYLETYDTPLRLFKIAEYFEYRIKDERVVNNRWNFEYDWSTVSEKLTEMKLKIGFQEKNKYLSNTENSMLFAIQRAIFFTTYQKLGAYAVFHQDADKIFSEKELREIKKTIDKVKEGTEKTGVIVSVVNGKPKLIQCRTSPEFFAVHYICNLLKTKTSEDEQKSIWDFILNVMFKRRKKSSIS